MLLLIMQLLGGKYRCIMPCQSKEKETDCTTTTTSVPYSKHKMNFQQQIGTGLTQHKIAATTRY